MSSSADALPSAGQLFRAPRSGWTARLPVEKFERSHWWPCARGETPSPTRFAHLLSKPTAKCRRASVTTKGTRCSCRWSRVKRAPGAASSARRRRRTADGTRSSSRFTRMCCSTLRTSRARAHPGFTCWKDAPVSACQRLRCPPPGRKRWRNRWEDSARWGVLDLNPAVHLTFILWLYHNSEISINIQGLFLFTQTRAHTNTPREHLRAAEKQDSFGTVPRLKNKIVSLHHFLKRILKHFDLSGVTFLSAHTKMLLLSNQIFSLCKSLRDNWWS